MSVFRVLRKFQLEPLQHVISALFPTRPGYVSDVTKQLRKQDSTLAFQYYLVQLLL